LILLRSILFNLWLWLSMPVFAIGLSPALLMPHRYAMKVIKLWAHTVLFGLRWLAGIEVVVTGLEHRPTGPALLAGKHQGMLDIVAPFTFLDDPCFVLKKELMPLPFFGWFAWKTKMVAVDRAAHARALKDMVRQTRARLAEGRQILIFPEGTRTRPGQPGDYKPGVAAIYRDLDAPCHLMATDSGRCWPAKGFIYRPGVVTFAFLPPLPAGLKRAGFMTRLETELETESVRLLNA
jgi:1-acyl-sn-glycerol-3-phosphate acyltransferase